MKEPEALPETVWVKVVCQVCESNVAVMEVVTPTTQAQIARQTDFVIQLMLAHEQIRPCPASKVAVAVIDEIEALALRLGPNVRKVFDRTSGSMN